MRDLFFKLSSGKLPFRAEMHSESGELASMEVHHASIVRDGIETVLLDDKIELSVGGVDAKASHFVNSAAMIEIPSDGSGPGIINTTGNASVTNAGSMPAIAISKQRKKLKASSEHSDLWCVAKVRMQRDTGISYFDFLFGVKGESEIVDVDGIKNRPHLAIHPDGNFKFIRLSGHECTINSEMVYTPAEKRIQPKTIVVSIKGFREQLFAKFVISDNVFELDDISFV